MDGAPPATPTTPGTSAPLSPAASSAGGAPDSSASATGLPEHTPPRRRLVKASSRIHFDEQSPRVIAKREGGAIGASTGPPGFGLDRSSGVPPTAPVGTGAAGPAVTSVGPSSPASINNTFRDRERTGIRPIIKGDVQLDYPLLSPHGPGATSGPGKLGRQPFLSNPGVMGDVRPLGRRPDSLLQRRHESPSGQKHAPDDIRIQQAKRACLSRAQSMGATGNYRNFDSPFGNYMVPVIPNQLFSKSPPPVTAPSSPSNVIPGVQGR